MLNRRILEKLPGVDVKTEESQGRLLQHIEDLDAISDDAFHQLCTGAHVFFNTLGTTRSIAGSAVSDTVLKNLLDYAMHVCVYIYEIQKGSGKSHNLVLGPGIQNMYNPGFT